MNLPLGKMAAGCTPDVQPEVHHAPAQSNGCEVRCYTQTVDHVVKTQTVRSDTMSGTSLSVAATSAFGSTISGEATLSTFSAGTSFSISTNGVTSGHDVTKSYSVTTSHDVTVTSEALLTSPLPGAGSLTQVGIDSKCAGAAADIAMSAHDRPEGRDCKPEGEVRQEPEAEVGDGTGGSMDEDEGERDAEGEGEGGEREVGIPRLVGDRILRHRSNRRPVHERFRQKRQTLQDMARPLKHWLYRHRANPYPTREEKTQLARKSAMTLTQVSNWFANARRRLKNTVQDPGLSWGRRIKLYNSCVEGNAERLSVCSDDEDGPLGDHDDLDDMWASDTDSGRLDDHHHSQEPLLHQQHPSLLHHNQIPNHHQGLPQTATHLPSQPAHHFPSHHQQAQNEHVESPTPVPPQEYDACGNSDDGSIDGASGQRQKYKASILQRYLQDACDMQQPAGGGGGDRHRHPSGSLSSHDYEEWSSSSCSSPSHNVFEDQLDGLDLLARQLQSQVPNDGDDMHFKEISAALALTTLKYRRMGYVRP